MLNAATNLPHEYEVKILSGDRGVVSQIADEWRALCEEGVSNQPFYRPEWFEAYLEAFEPQAKLLLFTVRNCGRLRAVLPLIEERALFLGVPVRKLRSPTNVHSNRFDIAVGSDSSKELLQRLWAALESYHWDVVELQDVPVQGMAREFLGCAQQAGSPVGLWESMRTPYIPLPQSAKDVESALGKSDSNFFSNLKKKMKKLEKSGAVQLNASRSADQTILDRFYDMEMATWKGREGTAIACDAATRRFYDLLAQAAARYGYLDIQTLTCGEDAAAMNFSLTLGGKHFIPKTTYSEKFSQSSPGQLIMREAIRSCLTQGIREMDFLGPWVSWKGHWTSETREHSHCYIFRAGAKGTFLHFLKFTAAATARRLKREWQRRRGARQAAKQAS
ncbi:MAG: GNAT family N-acetyltransferase [Deltaproteobacteria bacterium]|nr:GNAT family N-acetyltransferase [Deltaproteobacteria bacterium]